MKIHYSDLSEKEISLRLSESPQASIESPYPPRLIEEEPSPASVLIPFLKRENKWHLLFIRRTHSQQDRHSGQVAFPGGRADPKDLLPETTALREAQEEIGLDPADVCILGKLNDFLTITSYRVTPIVGIIPWPYPFRIDPSEVSRIFTIPLEWLTNPTNHEKRLRKLPYPFKPIQVIYFKPYNGEILWGASARFTMGLIDILFTRNER